MNSDLAINKLFKHLIIFPRLSHSLRCYLVKGSNQLLLTCEGLNLTYRLAQSRYQCAE